MSRPSRDPRDGLRMAAALATVLTVIGHVFLGLEQPWSQVVVALLTGYTAALGFEAVDAWANARRPRFVGGGARGVVDFLVSAHMTAITTSFLIFPNGRHGVMAFAVALAIGSKYALRVRRDDGRYVHFFNPSNFGIAVTLWIFPWVGVIPYEFLQDVSGPIDALVPIVIVALGTRLNVLYTRRMPLILAWVGGFVLQALVRAGLGLTPLAAALSPITGVFFVLFSFYMITDPMTSPRSVRGQIAFGLVLAATYGLLMTEHVIFTLFYAVFAVTGLRGAWMFVRAMRWSLGEGRVPVAVRA